MLLRIICFADNQTLTHLFRLLLQVVDAQDDKNRQIKREKTRTYEQSHRHRHTIILIIWACIHVDVIWKNTIDDVFEVEDEADRVGKDEYQVLIKSLLFIMFTLFDYYSSNCSFNCRVVLRETIPKISDKVITMQSMSKLVIIL